VRRFDANFQDVSNASLKVRLHAVAGGRDLEHPTPLWVGDWTLSRSLNGTCRSGFRYCPVDVPDVQGVELC
jgi:hypothetical protein